MNERGPKGYNPDELNKQQNSSEGLTSQGINPYAINGGKFMPEGTNGGADNPRSNERPWDPIDTPVDSSNVINIMDIPARNEDQLKSKAAWNQVFGGSTPRTPEERQILQNMIERGELPPTPLSFEQARSTRDQGHIQPTSITRATDAPDNQKANPTIHDEVEKISESRGEGDYGADGKLTESARVRLEQSIEGVRRSQTKDVSSWRQAQRAALKLWEDDPERYRALVADLSSQLAHIQDAEKAREALHEQGFNDSEITEEQIEATIEQLQTALPIPKKLDNIKEKILTSDNLQSARDRFENLRRYVRDINDNIANGNLKVSDATNQTLQEVAGLDESELDSLEKLQHYTSRVLSDQPGGLNIKKFFVQVEGGRQRGRLQIKSLEDLVELVAESQGGEFKPGGDYEILNERGEIQLQNLVAWIRKRIIASHGADPDSDINILSRVRVPTFYREITLDEMLFVPAYFQKRKVVIEGTEDHATMQHEHFEDSEYNRFKDNLLYEAWLFGESHNNDAGYRAVRGQEEPLFNKINQMCAGNKFTKDRSRFLNIFSLAKVDKDEMEAVGNREKQGSVGKAIQRAVLAYYHLWEVTRENETKNGLEVVVKDGKNVDVKSPDNNNFFATLGADGTDYFYQSMVEQLIEGKASTDIPFGRDLASLVSGIARNEDEKDLSEIALLLKYKKTELGNLLSSKLGIEIDQVELFEDNPRELATLLLKKVWNFKHSDLNIFDARGKDQRLINLVTNAITHSVGKKEGLSSDDTTYAGAWAATMRNWTGIAARNDTGGIGFDAWSKLINFKDYRTRQGQGRSGAGNIFNLPGFERLSVTLLDGLYGKIEEEGGKAQNLISILEESARSGNDIQSFDFEGEAMGQFAGQHVGNAYKVFTFLLEKQELKMSSIVKEDKYGNSVFDQEAAFKLMDSIWHDLRYAFDQAGFDYDKTKVKGWSTEIEYGKDGKPVFDESGQIKRKKVYKEQSLREHMFGQEMIRLADKIYKRQIVGGEDGKKKQKAMGKAAFAYLISKEIYAHRKWDSGYSRWTVEHIERMEEFFRRQALEFGQAEKDSIDVKVFQEFFTKEEWHEMLKLVKQTYRKLNTELVVTQLGESLLGGFVDTFSQISKQLTKVA